MLIRSMKQLQLACVLITCASGLVVSIADRATVQVDSL